MKALVLHELGGPLNLEEVPVPKVGPNDALVKVKVCGIGLSVKWSRRRGRVPRIPGHEIGGEVVEIGDQVTNVKVGDRVCVDYYITCGTCEFCRKNRETLCRNRRGQIGVVGDGGFAEYAALPSENVLPIPDEVSFEEASITGDAIGTVLHLIRERAQVRPPDTVMVVGAAGGVGIHAVQMAKLCGGWVIAVDISDEKLAKTRELGADAVINAYKEDFAEEAKRLTGGKGVDAVVDFVCTSDTLAKGLKSLDVAGRLVTLASGYVEPDTAATYPSGLLIGGEQVITRSLCTTKQEVIESLELVRRGQIKSVITQRFSLEEVEQAFKLLDEQTTFGRLVLVM